MWVGRRHGFTEVAAVERKGIPLGKINDDSGWGTLCYLASSCIGHPTPLSLSHSHSSSLLETDRTGWYGIRIHLYIYHDKTSRLKFLY